MPSKSFFFFEDSAAPVIYTLSLHDALPIWSAGSVAPAADEKPKGDTAKPVVDDGAGDEPAANEGDMEPRSEEHTSELQSQFHLVCRLLLEKKKIERPPTPLCAAHSPVPLPT